MENQEIKNTTINFKSQILLPVIFILTLAIGICFTAVDNFTEDLSPIVVWIFFAVSILYVAVAIIDTFIGKEKKKNTIVFVRIMSVLTFISSIVYIVLYLFNK